VSKIISRCCDLTKLCHINRMGSFFESQCSCYYYDVLSLFNYQFVTLHPVAYSRGRCYGVYSGAIVRQPPPPPFGLTLNYSIIFALFCKLRF